jgi:putative NADH-flavin reductase
MRARQSVLVRVGSRKYETLKHTMKLLVLGATGGTGLEIISQAIERGHSLTAFVRAPDPLKRFGERIAVIRGNILNSSELQRVLEGHDAVLSSFGPRLPISGRKPLS